MYTYVDAIVFAGNQQINTGLYTTGVTETEVKFTKFSKNDTYGFVYGGYNNGGRPGGLFCARDYEAHVSIGSGEAAQINEDIQAPNITFSLTIDTTNYTGEYQWCSNTPVPFTWSGSYNTMPIQIGGMNTSGKYQMGKFWLFGFKAWQNDVLVRDMRPAIRDSDGVTGLHDVVNDQFYTNVWSGSFEVRYLWYMTPDHELINSVLGVPIDSELFVEPYPASWWVLGSDNTLTSALLPAPITSELFIEPYPALFWRYDAEQGQILTTILPKYLPLGAFARSGNLSFISIPPATKQLGPESFKNTQLRSVTIAQDCEYYPTTFPPGCKINKYE